MAESTFKLLVPGDRDDPAVREVLSWDKNGDGEIEYTEVRHAAMAVVEAKALARTWRTRTGVMAVSVAAVLAILFSVALASNALTQEFSTGGGDAELKSARGLKATGDVDIEKVGPSLWDLHKLPTAQLATLRRVTVPLSPLDGHELSSDIASFTTRVTAPNPQAASFNLSTTLREERTVSFSLANGMTLRVGREALALVSGGSRVDYVRGPLDPASNEYDIVFGPNADGLGALSQAAAPANGTASARRRPHAEPHPIRPHDTHTTLAAMFHGGDDPRWHRENNPHWGRRCAVLDRGTGRMYHFPRGLAEAHSHRDPGARALVAGSGGGVRTLQDPATSTVVVTFTARPHRTTVASIPGTGAFPASMLPEQTMADITCFSSPLVRIPNCKQYTEDINAGIDKCEVDNAGGTQYAIDTCKRTMSIRVCFQHCSRTPNAPDYGETTNGNCQRHCRPDVPERIQVGFIVYGPDGSAVATHPRTNSMRDCPGFDEDMYAKAGRPHSESHATWQKAEEGGYTIYRLGKGKTPFCKTTLLPKDGILPPGEDPPPIPARTFDTAELDAWKFVNEFKANDCDEFCGAHVPDAAKGYLSKCDQCDFAVKKREECRNAALLFEEPSPSALQTCERNLCVLYDQISNECTTLHTSNANAITSIQYRNRNDACQGFRERCENEESGYGKPLAFFHAIEEQCPTMV